MQYWKSVITSGGNLYLCLLRFPFSPGEPSQTCGCQAEVKTPPHGTAWQNCKTRKVCGTLERELRNNRGQSEKKMRKISIYAPCYLYLLEAKSGFHKARSSWLGQDGRAGEEGEGGTRHQPTFPSLPDLWFCYFSMYHLPSSKAHPTQGKA